MANARTAGTAASWAALQASIEAFLVANGWTASAGTGTNRLIQKAASSLAIRLDYTASAHPRIVMFGGTGVSGTALVNETPAGSAMLNVAGTTIGFPLDYELHWLENPEEFYCVIKYNGDKYQHLHFGKSDVPGIGGTGMWHYGAFPAVSAATNGNILFLQVGPTNSGSSSGYGDCYTMPYSSSFFTGGFFLTGESASWAHAGGIHCELEGAVGWKYTNGNSGAAGDLCGYNRQSAALMNAAPSGWNEATLLFPIYIGVHRSSTPVTIAAIMRHARLCRIDNVNPEQVITYGSEQWKVYPIYSKNVTQRDGVTYNTGAAHSGTIGVAIRYTP